MKDLDLSQLRTFCLVAELGSFSGAAERLGVSQPAISMQMRELEKKLGVRLLERVGKRAIATPAGAELVRRAADVRAAVDAAISALRPHSEGIVGHVRIGAGATFCIYLLPSILRRLRSSFPGLEITVLTGTTAEILQKVEANDLDVGVVTLPVGGRTLDVTLLIEDDYLAVAPAEDKDCPDIFTPSALSERPLILFEPGGSTRRLVDQWFSKSGFRATPVMNLGSVEAVKELVGAGLGYSVLPAMALRPVSDASWTTRPLSPPLRRTLGLAVRRDKQLARSLRETLGAFKGTLG